MNRKKIKSTARQNLLGHYGCAIGAMIIAGIVSLIAVYFSQLMTSSYASNVVIGIIGYIFFVLFGMLLQAGVSYVHLRLARGQQTKATYVSFAVKNNPKKYIAYGILASLMTTVCVTPGAVCLVLASMKLLVIGRVNVLAFVSVALLAVGTIILIVILLSWQMTTYILLDDPNVTVIGAIKKSRHLMRKNKWRLFVLGLSFIGWYLFSVLTLFIGLLWIKPYVSQTMVCFYLNLLTGNGQTVSSHSD